MTEYYKRGTGIKTDKSQIEAKEKDEQMFDRTTGIKNAKLRASLSVAEKDSEKIKVLKKFGLSDDDFTQDNRGQFALTPSGAKQFGLETDKNVIIDESGLTRYDFADLAGIVPERTLVPALNVKLEPEGVMVPAERVGATPLLSVPAGIVTE